MVRLRARHYSHACGGCGRGFWPGGVRQCQGETAIVRHVLGRPLRRVDGALRTLMVDGIAPGGCDAGRDPPACPDSMHQGGCMRNEHMMEATATIRDGRGTSAT